MSPFRRGCGSSNAIDGDIINERQGTKTDGAIGSRQEGQAERRGGWSSDGGMLSAGQENLASLQKGRRRGSGASQSWPARCSAQSGKVPGQSAGSLPATLPGFRADVGG